MSAEEEKFCYKPWKQNCWVAESEWCSWGKWCILWLLLGWLIMNGNDGCGLLGWLGRNVCGCLCAVLHCVYMNWIYPHHGSAMMTAPLTFPSLILLLVVVFLNALIKGLKLEKKSNIKNCWNYQRSCASLVAKLSRRRIALRCCRILLLVLATFPP